MKENQCKLVLLWLSLVGGPDIKLGGVIALMLLNIFKNAGLENYWQITFLVLGISYYPVTLV